MSLEEGEVDTEPWRQSLSLNPSREHRQLSVDQYSPLSLSLSLKTGDPCSPSIHLNLALAAKNFLIIYMKYLIGHGVAEPRVICSGWLCEAPISPSHA